MNRSLVLVVTVLVLAVSCGTQAAASSPAAASGAPKVDIAYLNHPPVLMALGDVNKLLDSYGSKIAVARHDFDTPEGEAFAKQMHLEGHVPIAIFVNGTMDAKLGSRAVKFYSFPAGSGTFMAPGGTWTADDLKQVIDQALGQGK